MVLLAEHRSKVQKALHIELRASIKTQKEKQYAKLYEWYVDSGMENEQHQQNRTLFKTESVKEQ